MAGTINKGTIVKSGGSGGGGGSQATLNIFKSPTWDLDATGKELNTHLTLGNAVLVFKNGNGPLEEGVGNDFTISGSIITFTTALLSTDKIELINGNISAIDLSPYMLKPTIVTNGDNTGLVVQANKIYKFDYASPLSSLVITSAETSDYESVIYFATSSSFSFTDNANLKWGGGEGVPTFDINTIYCIAIKNGLAEFDKFGTIA